MSLFCKYGFCTVPLLSWMPGGILDICRVHTYRIRTDTDNDTRHPGQEKWDCAESIHTE
ncbi:unnamed protein product [Staurois parvus]|uniref:Uncharacterized protein n=1 Tax=Staurois parvus TaxID=386267 RepID=A0ABN9ENN9_9NEOB|nr:unnamed protein product [Staurois parvus]